MMIMAAMAVMTVIMVVVIDDILTGGAFSSTDGNSIASGLPIGIPGCASTPMRALLQVGEIGQDRKSRGVVQPAAPDVIRGEARSPDFRLLGLALTDGPKGPDKNKPMSRAMRLNRYLRKGSSPEGPRCKGARATAERQSGRGPGWTLLLPPTPSHLNPLNP